VIRALLVTVRDYWPKLPFLIGFLIITVTLFGMLR
jgi:hypothetical protein